MVTVRPPILADVDTAGSTLLVAPASSCGYAAAPPVVLNTVFIVVSATSSSEYCPRHQDQSNQSRYSCGIQKLANQRLQESLSIQRIQLRRNGGRKARWSGCYNSPMARKTKIVTVFASVAFVQGQQVRPLSAILIDRPPHRVFILNL